MRSRVVIGLICGVMCSSYVFAVPCRLSVETISKAVSTNSRFETGRETIIRRSDDQKEEKSTMMLLLESGYSSSLTMDNESFKVTCYKRGDHHELTFSLSSKSGEISTSLGLSSGERKMLGSVVNELKDKKKKLDLAGQNGIETENQNGVKEYWIRAE